jgi:hypothetical protein
MILCNICDMEYEKEYISFKDKEEKQVHICEDCAYCEFCEEKMSEIYSDLSEIDESNWLPYKRPNFPSGWIFKTKEELKEYMVDDTILVCNFCAKVEYCSICQYKCKHFCEECETTCSHCECKESEN